MLECRHCPTGGLAGCVTKRNRLTLQVSDIKVFHLSSTSASELVTFQGPGNPALQLRHGMGRSLIPGHTEVLRPRRPVTTTSPTFMDTQSTKLVAEDPLYRDARQRLERV